MIRRIVLVENHYIQKLCQKVLTTITTPYLFQNYYSFNKLTPSMVATFSNTRRASIAHSSESKMP